jgi:hypothetical protein
MRNRLFSTLLAAALALGVGATQVRADTNTPAPAKKVTRHHVRHAHRTYSAQVACTAFGCHPLPPGCHPTQGYDFWGNPSAFDAVICR